MKDLPKILTHSEFQKHVELDVSLRPVLEAPVTEVIIVYFPPTTSSQEQMAISAFVLETIKPGLDACAEVKAVCCGWGVENDFPILGHGYGKDTNEVGSACLVFVGWQSVDAAKAYWRHRARFEGSMMEKGAVGVVSRFIECREFGSGKA